ncbi:hypothetical protein V8C34DRAFT_312462 [Trichoderma compactum]
MFRHAKRLLSKKSEQTASRSITPDPNGDSTSNATVQDRDGTGAISYQPMRSSNNLRDSASELSALPPQVVRESRHGLKVLVSQPLDKRNAVDIVAIHGLNGDRVGTWTDKTTNVNWLSNASCLPKDVPNARVFSFGYNSATYFSRSNSDVQDYASELLAEVKAHRRSDAEKRRPIVFICHSLGGLVFKQAMVRAHEQNQFYSSLMESVRGVIFFATPHKGSSLAFWDLVGTRIVQAAAFGMAASPNLPKDLKVNSEMLNRISNSFAYRGCSIKIRSFYETEFMPFLNCRARLGERLDIASTANHSSICKFASATDHRYQTAIDAILDIINTPDETTTASEEVSCISRLNSEYEHHLDQVDNPVSGTCEWILSHNKWQQWQTWPHSSLLWITSNAGCGKSVTAKFLVNYFKTKRGVNSAQSFGYFFFMDSIAGQDNATAAVSGLLHQLYRSQHGLIKHALNKLEGNLSHVRFSTLWQILVDSINDDNAKDVLWVLDGVEECEAQSLRQFMRALSALFEPQTATKGTLRNCNLKVVLLSRPSSLIQQALGLFSEKDSVNGHLSNKLRLSGEDENQALTVDILRFAHSKINELTLASALPENVLKRLQERLIAGADFTFLWISLVIKVVEDSTLNGISVVQLEKILNTTNLDNIYQQLLEGPSRAKDPPRAFFPYAAVQWVRHYRSVRDMLMFKYDELLQPGTKLFNVWIKVHGSWREDHTTRSGAIQINESADDLQTPERRFAQNPKFHTLKEFLDQEEWTIGARNYEILAFRVEEMNHLFTELTEEWSQAINEYSDYRIVLSNPEQTKDKNATAHIRDIRKKMEVEKKLLEALMHFDLLNLSEAGLEGDEFLLGYWQSRSYRGHYRKDDEGGEEEYGDGGGGWIDDEGSIPDWIKHYIRKKHGAVIAGHTAISR